MGSLTFAQACAAARRHGISDVQHGRYFVAVTLAEAEAIRALLHARRARAEPVLPGSGATLALSHGAMRLESSLGFEPSRGQQAVTARQCLRLFDSELDYTPREINVVLRALQVRERPQLASHLGDIISASSHRWRRALPND